VNGQVGIDSTLTPITVRKGSAMPPKATENASFVANLDGRAKVGDTFSAAVQIFDSLGGTHSVTFTFTNGGPGGWGWNATIPAADTGGAATAPPVSVGTGSVTFDANGLLTSPMANPSLTVAGLASGAADMTITLGLWDANGSAGITGFSATSAVSSTNQDGHTSSVLKDISFDNKGIVNGVYDNGQVQPIAQLALANFANVEGLLKFKGATFVNSIASGEASIGSPGSGGRGTISGSSLEQSNVDIAQEFSTLIVAQRGYQANSRVITTTDELYQDAINMKR
jgi:flagellar hook protein FlgE